MPIPPPPSPKHLLRSHTEPISGLCFSNDNERLYSGDASGLVVITSTRTLRSLVSWQAHTSGILGLEEWETELVITHGRDNQLHVWKRAEELSTTFLRGGSAGLPPSSPAPKLIYSLDVNTMNFCRFSLLPIESEQGSAFVAVPNLVESSLANPSKVDVWTLPSRQRMHAAIGKTRIVSPETIDTGIVMSLHLHRTAHPSRSDQSSLQLLIAYENGSVEMWKFTRSDGKQTSVEGVGWESIWSVKQHVETVMAMTVSRDLSFALSVSADHLVGRYELQKASENELNAFTIHRTKHPGNAAVAIHDNGRVCAIGGWDGRIRLYSTKSFKSLGTLDYHKTGCQVVTFARSDPTPSTQDKTDLEDEEDGMDDEEKAARNRWLVGGGKDGRVSIWSLIDFSVSKK